ncbi:MAG: hypothetical protein U0736_14115 [Gemmataceae bacterium]
MLHRLLPRWLAPAVVVVLVGLVYIAWRAPGQFVWDDSPTLCENEFPEPGVAIDPLTPHLSDRWKYGDEFGRTHPDGYRPLSWMMRRIGQAGHAAAPATTRVGLLLLNALVAGLLALAHFRLARRFTCSPVAASFAVFLLLAAMPILTGLLVLFTGIQALVLLVMCACLNSYFCYRDTGHGGWLVGVALLLLLGPWYREFVGLTAVLLVLLELQRGQWRSPVVAVAVVGFAHALFPTALPHLAFPELPVRPVWRLGALKDQIEFTVASNPHAWLDVAGAIRGLQWRIFLDLLNILPPTLVLLAAAGWVGSLRRRDPAEARGGLFLAGFFAVTFLPFLVVFKEQVHLAYALVPASILLAAGVERLWRLTAEHRALRVATVALLALAVTDHGLNPFVVRSFTRRSYATIARLTRRCEAEMKPGAVVLANPHHAWELRFLTKGKLSCFFTAMTSGNRPMLVPDPPTLQAMIDRAGDAGVYLLDARLPVTDGQPGCDRIHWIVRDRVIDLLHYGEVAKLSFRYPVLDPLKWLLPIEVTSFPGSPDLEFDYYRGPALDGARGVREVAVGSHLYKVVGRAVRPGPPRPVYLHRSLVRDAADDLSPAD